MKKWEYKCLRTPNDRPDLEEGLNNLGKEGWELVSAGTLRSNFGADYISLFTFKREIPEQAGVDKLEAIRRIATGAAIDSSKLVGIQHVLESDEGSAESIAISFSHPRP